MGWFDGERGWAAGRRARHEPCWFRPRRIVGGQQLSSVVSRSGDDGNDRIQSAHTSTSITSATSTASTSHALSLGPSPLATPRRSCGESLLFDHVNDCRRPPTKFPLMSHSVRSGEMGKRISARYFYFIFFAGIGF